MSQAPKGLCFHVYSRLFVCLSAKTAELIYTILGGSMRCEPRKNRFHFGPDQVEVADPGSFVCQRWFDVLNAI